jgi:beta-lactamase regulating signal transducer with metallopeptidase domain
VRLVVSSVLLGLVWFAAANALASLTAWGAGAVLLRRREPVRAAFVLALRLFPAVASSLFVLAVFLPTHWRLEPLESDESFGFVLAIIATSSVFVLARSFYRAVRSGLAGRRFALLVRQAAKLIEGDTFELGAFDGVSLAGIWRPTILVGAGARAALTRDELDLAISHEIAHRQSRDNLKRFLMFGAPDFFGWTSVARQLEARWQAEAECEADAQAVRGDDSRAVVLASALVKVAKLRASTHPALPVWMSSAFHVPTLLELRVRRLVSGASCRPLSRTRLTFSGALVGLVLSASLWLLEVSETLHAVTEAMVTHLP